LAHELHKLKVGKEETMLNLVELERLAEENREDMQMDE